jgi:hypothetical protein
MTNKQIAERLRRIEERALRIVDAQYQCGPLSEVSALADELDPPIPAPGSVVAWRRHGASSPSWNFGVVSVHQKGVYSRTGVLWTWAEIQWNEIFSPDTLDDNGAIL